MTGYPWEHALDFLQADGWSYRRQAVKSKTKSEPKEWVEISRNGLCFAISAPTLDEAVGALYGIASLVERGQITA